MTNLLVRRNHSILIPFDRPYMQAIVQLNGASLLTRRGLGPDVIVLQQEQLPAGNFVGSIFRENHQSK